MEWLFSCVEARKYVDFIRDEVFRAAMRWTELQMMVIVTASTSLLFTSLY